MATNQITHDSDFDDIVHAVSTALIAIAHPLGAIVAALRGSIYSGNKQKRITEFILSLKEDIEFVKNDINENYVSLEDFIDIFEYTLNMIIETRQFEKRQIFRRILVNSIISQDTSYDETEELMRLMQRLRYEHVFMLKVLSNPYGYNANHGNKLIKGNYITVTSLKILGKLLGDWKHEDILEVVKDLENERLVIGLTRNSHVECSEDGLINLLNKLTPKGERFLRFVSDKKH